MIARKVKKQDFQGICSVQFERYKVMYAQNPHKKFTYKEMLKIRMQIAADWMWVLQQNGRILGCLTAQPTNKGPEHFKSWEESTDNGTLMRTFQSSGKYLYIVNIQALEEATQKSAHLLLIQACSKQIDKTNINLVYCEGRLPCFREWVHKNIGLQSWNNFSETRKMKLLYDYVNTKIERYGKQVYYDKLINFFVKCGGTIQSVVLNAFDDPQSLNCGIVVCDEGNSLFFMEKRRRMKEQARMTSKQTQLIHGVTQIEENPKKRAENLIYAKL